MNALTILFRCVKCGVVFEDKGGYDLNYQYGKVRLCPECKKESK